jgi:hypothetical protein
MNAFKFSCPHCQQNIEATPEYAGLQINCPNCQTPMVVPKVPTAAVPKPGKLTKVPSTVQYGATTPAIATAIARKAKKPRVGLYVGLGVGAVVAVAAILFVPKLLDKYHEHQAAVAAEQAAANAPPPPPPPPDLKADEILKKVGAAYKGFSSYGAQGDSVGTIDLSQINPAAKEPQTVTAKLSILLGRPDLYRIEWERQAGPKSLKGAAWSSGKGDYVLTGTAATKVQNRQVALSTAGAASGTLCASLAGLFFDATNSLTVALKHYAKTNNETLNGRKCYVLTGQIASQNVLLWIHKDDFLIAQAEVVLGGKMDDSMMAGLSAAQKTQMQMMSKLKGNIMETYKNIEMNKVLNADAFQAAFTPNTFTPNTTPKRKAPGGARPPGRAGRANPE